MNPIKSTFSLNVILVCGEENSADGLDTRFKFSSATVTFAACLSRQLMTESTFTCCPRSDVNKVLPGVL